MISFPGVFDQQRLTGKSIGETSQEQVSPGNPLNRLAISCFYSDINASLGLPTPQPTAIENLTENLSRYAPEVKWNVILSIHQNVLSGIIELTKITPSKIMQLVRQSAGINFTPEVRSNYGPEYERNRGEWKMNYLRRFPHMVNFIDQGGMSLNEFLEAHPAGSFQTLEDLRDGKLEFRKIE